MHRRRSALWPKKHCNLINPKTKDWYHLNDEWLRSQMEKDISTSIENIPTGRYFLKTIIAPFVFIFLCMLFFFRGLYVTHLSWMLVISFILTIPFYSIIKRIMEKRIYHSSVELRRTKERIIRLKIIELRNRLNAENNNDEKDLVKIARLNRHLREIRILRNSIRTKARSSDEVVEADGDFQELTLKKG